MKIAPSIARMTSSPIGQICAITFACIPAVCIAAWAAQTSIPFALALSLGFALSGVMGVRFIERVEWRPVPAAIGLIGQAIALTAAFSGHAWQTHSHMAYFALLAMLVGIGSVRALIAGVVLIAVHHVGLVFLAPALLFPSTNLASALALTAFHAGIVLLEAAALVVAVVARQRLDARQEKNAEALAASTAEAQQARDSALTAQAEAEAAQRAAQAEAARAEEALVQATRDQQARAAMEEQARLKDAEAQRAVEARAAETRFVVDVMRTALSSLAGGDLTARIETPFAPDLEDLRAAYNSAVDVLDDVIANVVEEVSAFEMQAEEITSAANDLASRTEKQASTLQDTAASLDVLTRAVAQTREVVETAVAAASAAHEYATASSEVADGANQSMSSIEDGSQKIGRIVAVIDDIAFQTNLLALNAGVEAARAGEAGRGFAVVASEVRSLAQRSSDSAGSIRNLIAESTDDVNQGAGRMASTVEALGGVQEAVERIARQMADIAKAARGQETEISSINASVNQLDQVTQANAAMFEETSAASAQLVTGAARLRGATAAFKTRNTTRVGSVIKAA